MIWLNVLGIVAVFGGMLALLIPPYNGTDIVLAVLDICIIALNLEGIYDVWPNYRARRLFMKVTNGKRYKARGRYWFVGRFDRGDYNVVVALGVSKRTISDPLYAVHSSGDFVKCCTVGGTGSTNNQYTKLPYWDRMLAIYLRFNTDPYFFPTIAIVRTRIRNDRLFKRLKPLFDEYIRKEEHDKRAVR